VLRLPEAASAFILVTEIPGRFYQTAEGKIHNFLRGQFFSQA